MKLKIFGKTETRCLCIALAAMLASCSAQETTCHSRPDAGLMGCVRQAAFEHAHDSGSSLSLVRTVVKQCDAIINKDLDFAQKTIGFPESLRDQYRALIQRDAEHEALRGLYRARTTNCGKPPV